MDMWCPYGIGRESWDRVISDVRGSRPFPLNGEASLAGVFPFAGVSGSPPMKVIVVVVAVVVVAVVVVVVVVVVAVAVAVAVVAAAAVVVVVVVVVELLFS